MDERPHVVIIGGGFGGLYAARRLASAPVRVTLVDRRNHHLFQPLLYQVATSGLAAPDIAAPIRQVLRRQENATVLLAEVVAIEPEAKRVVLDEGELAYDQLILAAGMVHSYFGRDEWAPHAPGLKTLEDAFEVRRRLLLAFEHAEREEDETERRRWLTFAVIGAGPTGVELAGAIREIASRTLTHDFRNFDPDTTRVVLIDGSDRVLPTFPAVLSSRAGKLLEARRVELQLGELVTEIDESGVTIENQHIEARTVLWAAGVRGSPLAEFLGCDLTRDGRVPVEPDLSVPGRPEVFVIGDLAYVEQDGVPVPGVAPGAIQAGRQAAENALRSLRGEQPRPFHYKDRGLLATVGRSAAVARVGGLHFGGFVAWVLWLFVHVFWLIGFRSRLVVMLEWAWAYVTWQRSARVILNRE